MGGEESYGVSIRHNSWQTDLRLRAADPASGLYDDAGPEYPSVLDLIVKYANWEIKMVGMHGPAASGSGVGRLRLLAFSVTGLILSGADINPAMAQSVNPGVPTREELDRGTQQAGQQPSRLTVDGDLERSPCALDNPAYGDIRVTLTKATFANLGPVPENLMAETYQQYLGTQQPITVVCQIRDAAATKLRGMGYIAAVEVPVQRITNGEIRFEVLYAKVTSVRVVGKAGRNEKLFAAYLQKLADGQFFNRFKAERVVLLARDVPGYDVRLSLKPAGSGAGNMIAEVRLEQTPVTVDFTANNLAATSTGRVGGQLRASFNGLTGMGDRTTLAVYSTSDFREQQIYSIGHEMLLGGNGLRLGGHLTYAETSPTLGAAVPPVDGRTVYANLELGYPLIRRQAFTLRSALGLDILNQKVLFGGAPLSRDRLRVAYVRFDMDSVDLKGVGPDGSVGWRANGTVELRKGLNILGASPDCATALALCGAAGFVPPSIAQGNPQATVLRASATVEAHLLRPLTFMISPRMQISSDPVFAFEQSSLGNFTIGRGFDPGTLTGDSGVGFIAEARMTPFRLSPQSHLELQPYLFSDNGWTWQRRSPLPGARHLNSVGGGLRITLSGQARLDLSAAVPLSTLPGETNRRPVRGLVSLAVNMLPWRLN